jgi:hypothetical protein
MIEFGILLIFLYICYHLFIKGYAWPILFFLFAFLGAYFLFSSISIMHTIFITIANINISYAGFCAFAIPVMGIWFLRGRRYG